MSSAMPNYPYFLSQVTTVVYANRFDWCRSCLISILCSFWTVRYLPFFFGLVAYELAFTNLITPEMRAFPKSKFFAMGAFDAVSGVFMSVALSLSRCVSVAPTRGVCLIPRRLFGGVHTSGSTQALLMNAVIPVTSTAVVCCSHLDGSGLFVRSVPVGGGAQDQVQVCAVCWGRHHSRRCAGAGTVKHHS